MGETWVSRVDELAPYYGDGDELQLALNFPFIFAPFDPQALARVVADSMEQFPPGSATVWAGSNHDLPRAATRWAEGDPRRARLAQTILAMLPGTYVLYYGDELGMTDSDIPADLHRDPLTAGGLNGQWPRDNARAPMRWDASEGRWVHRPEHPGYQCIPSTRTMSPINERTRPRCCRWCEPRLRCGEAISAIPAPPTARSTSRQHTGYSAAARCMCSATSPPRQSTTNPWEPRSCRVIPSDPKQPAN